MRLKKSLSSGIVAFVVTTLAVRVVGGKGTKIGLLIGGSVAVASMLFGGSADAEVEFEDEVSVE
jgi:hypothetical protein